MDIFLNRYADVILQSSLKLKKGDVLSINTEECNSRFAHIIADKARAITGNGSYIQLIENGKVIETEEASTEFPINQKPTALLYLPTYKEYKEAEKNKEYSAPELQEYRLLSEPLYNPVPSLPFASAPVPNDIWGGMLDEDGDESLAASIISDLLSLGEDDYLEALKNSDDILEYEKEKLNALDFVSGRITSEEGTDITFKFLAGSIFATEQSETNAGRTFSPIIYHSNILRALDTNSVNGYLNITKPITLFGRTISNLSLTFENGSITDFSTDERSAELIRLYLMQDRQAGKASMLSISEETNPASFIDYFYLPELDRMRCTSLIIGSPRPEGIEEDAKNNTVDSLVSLTLPIGSDSLIIEAINRDGDEFTIVEDGIIQENE